jgi:hypothetical protein
VRTTTYQPEGLLLALARLDGLLKRAVATARDVYESGDSSHLLRGLYVDVSQVERLLEHEPGAPLLWGEPDDGDYVAADGSRLAWLQQTFGLSSFEMDVVLIALAPELDLRYERIYGYLQDDVTRKRPTVDLALHLLCPTAGARLADRAHFATDAALIRHDLVKLIPPDAAPDPPLLAHALRLDEQIVRLLVGGSELDRRLMPICELVTPEVEWDEGLLSDDTVDRLSRLVARARAARKSLRLYFRAPDRLSRRRAADVLARRIGMRLLAVDAAEIPGASADVDETLRLLFREAWLQDAVLFLDGIDPSNHPSETPNNGVFGDLVAFESDECDVTILGGERTWIPVGRGMTGVLTVEIPASTYQVRLETWRARLGDAGMTVAAEGIEALAERFRLSPDQIADAVTIADNRAAWHDAEPGPVPTGKAAKIAAKTQVTPPALEDLFAAAREQSGNKLSAHAFKVSPLYRWDDIVVPAETLSQLREMCSWVAHRQRVLSDWGFGQRLSHGKGVAALFFGPSGTGKTMSAEIIAGELGLDLFKIDLSAVMSKYIGDTEKNLARIFSAAQDANAILFFDEADALYGRRSEVRDSHDRYANVEISFLLQQMEQYEGIAILATNLRQNMDDAFIRRLQFAIEFPFPDEDERRRIWEVHFPVEAPRDPAIDFGLLGREYRIAGGNIKNIVLASAFLAAGEALPIGMDHILRATRRELQKMGKVVASERRDVGFPAGITAVNAGR